MLYNQLLVHFNQIFVKFACNEDRHKILLKLDFGLDWISHIWRYLHLSSEKIRWTYMGKMVSPLFSVAYKNIYILSDNEDMHYG